MKRILTSFALVAASLAFSQVSVSGDDAHTPEATLDVEAIGGNTTADGVLIPRVDRLRAQNMQNVKHSTLIYINSVDNGAQSGQATQIDAKGFYYFDTDVNSGEWVKLGGGASTTSSAPEKTIRSVTQITANEWDNGQYALIQTTNADITLPAPTANRIIAISNQGGAPANYTSPAPKNNSAIMPGKGQLLMADGNRWYVIGGL